MATKATEVEYFMIDVEDGEGVVGRASSCRLPESGVKGEGEGM